MANRICIAGELIFLSSLLTFCRIPPLFLEAAVDVTNDPVEFVRPVYLSAAIVPGVLTMKNRCRDFKNEFPKQFFTM